MKKFLILFLALILLASCQKNYKCVITYRIDYPDTSWVKTYEFDGSWEARQYIYEASNGRKTLFIYPYSNVNIGSQEIATVPKGDSDITVLDFKMYRYGIDVPRPITNSDKQDE